MLVKTVSVHEGKKNVDGHVQGAGAAYEGGTAGRVSHGEVFQEGFEGGAADPSEGGCQQAGRGRAVEEDGGAGYAAAGVVGGADSEETPLPAVHDRTGKQAGIALFGEACRFQEDFFDAEGVVYLRSAPDGIHEGPVGDSLGEFEEAGAVFAVAEGLHEGLIQGLFGAQIFHEGRKGDGFLKEARFSCPFQEEKSFRPGGGLGVVVGLQQGPQGPAGDGACGVGLRSLVQEGAEFHGGGCAAVGERLRRAGRSEDAVKDHAVVAMVGGVAVTIPVPGVQVEFHVPAHQARRFGVDEGVPEVGARFGAPAAGVEDSYPAAFGGPEVLLAGGSLPPEAGEQGLGNLALQGLLAFGPGEGFWRGHGQSLHGNV